MTWCLGIIISSLTIAWPPQFEVGTSLLLEDPPPTKHRVSKSLRIESPGRLASQCIHSPWWTVRDPTTLQGYSLPWLPSELIAGVDLSQVHVTPRTKHFFDFTKHVQPRAKHKSQQAVLLVLRSSWDRWAFNQQQSAHCYKDMLRLITVA